MKTICFTGRRPKYLCGYKSHEPYTHFVSELVEILRAYYMLGYKRFISGGAQGFDQLAFWAVEQLKHQYDDIENIVYIPFIGYGGQWVKDGVFGQQEYKLMLDRADEIHYCIAENISTNGAKVLAALTNRNHAMVDNADLVIALYPEENFQFQKGGTAECMRYAVITKHKPLLHLGYDNKNYLSITSMKYYGEDLWKPQVKEYDFNQIARDILEIKQEYLRTMSDNDRATKGALIESVIMRNVQLNPEIKYDEDAYRKIIQTIRRNCEAVI